ncbi:MAG: large subunit ribosomal protein [Acidimicrobiaceae bacterium]|nr:large subunit ribosomal protein [Acidimicrobiaceae bacterium]
MTGPKTNERPGTRAVLKFCQISAFKIRPVLDLVRGKEVAEARDILRFSERDAAFVVGKLLDSAVANAAHNDELDPEELFVSACYADEGMTHKRWRPRARGRATRIRKRTSHITVIVSRLPEDRLQRLRAKRAAETSNRRARRVAGGRQGRRRRRDEELPGTTEPVATEAAATVEQTVAEQDAAVNEETVNEETVETTEPTAAEVAEAVEEAGIVDQQAEAVAVAEEAAETETETETETEKEEGE